MPINCRFSPRTICCLNFSSTCYFSWQQYNGVFWVIVIKGLLCVEMTCLFIWFQHSSLPITGREYCRSACVYLCVCTLLHPPFIFICIRWHTTDIAQEVGAQLQILCVCYMMEVNYLFALPPRPIVFPSPRASYPRSAILLRAVVPEQRRYAGEPLRAASAGPGNGPDTPPPGPASLGLMPGLWKTASAGRQSSYTYYSCERQPMTTRRMLLFLKRKKV